jgi:chromosome segregation ATPase
MASANAQVPVAESERLTELDRLERAIRELVALKASLQTENAVLEKSLEESVDRLDAIGAAHRELQERLLVEGQRRQDALKRIDDLVGRIENFDPSIPSGEG